MTKSKLVLGALLLLGSLHATADVFDDTAAKKAKSSLKEACEDDTECVQAVDSQFDACLKDSDFEKYMNASPAEEDKYLASTFNHLYSCIVNQEGEPYFTAPEE
jgi:hypothetical protein